MTDVNRVAGRIASCTSTSPPSFSSESILPNSLKGLPIFVFIIVVSAGWSGGHFSGHTGSYPDNSGNVPREDLGEK